MSVTTPTTPSTNRLAIIAFILALLTLSSFCIGVAPIPLTGLVCYPAAVLLGIAALVFGFRGLRQIRATGQRGKRLAWFGVLSGALTILMILFLITVTLIILLYGMNAVQPVWPHYFGPTL